MDSAILCDVLEGKNADETSVEDHGLALRNYEQEMVTRVKGLIGMMAHGAGGLLAMKPLGELKPAEY